MWRAWRRSLQLKKSRWFPHPLVSGISKQDRASATTCFGGYKPDEELVRRDEAMAMRGAHAIDEPPPHSALAHDS